MLQDAFLLHRWNYRETSLLLEVFTREHGILRLIAKGALRSKGMGAMLRPFLPLCVSWVGRSEPKVLTAAESRAEAYELCGKTLFCGFYLNELLLRLLPAHDPQPGIFAFYDESLRRLQRGERLDETLRFFELALLDAIGYGLELEYEIVGGSAIRPDRCYTYLPEQGPQEAPAGTETIQGSTLLALRDGRLSGADEIGEAKRLMRRVINHYLGGRPLKSRELFKYMKV